MQEEIEKQISEKIEDLRVFLAIEGGDIEFIQYKDGYVYVKLLGRCANCGFLDVTLKETIESYLQEEIPEIKGVINVSL